MNKTELVCFVAQETELTKKDSSKVINALLSCMTVELAMGGKIRMTDFGSFKIKECAAKIGKNPRTQEPVSVSRSKKVVFRPGKELKGHVKI